MKLRKWVALLAAVGLLLGCAVTAGAYDGVTRDGAGNIRYTPCEQGGYAQGGYTIEKISNPVKGTGEVDGILTGAAGDRGNSDSWSMTEVGDYLYIGTCCSAACYIFHNNLETTLREFKAQGFLDESVDPSEIADNLVEVIFGIDTFDKTKMANWNPVIMAVHKVTGEAEVIFRERDLWEDHPDLFPGCGIPGQPKNYLSGYRMAVEFRGKLYFAGMGNPTATLVEVDPATNEAAIAYCNINQTPGVSNGVQGLRVYGDELLMCLATDDYDGKGTPGGIIVASADGADWRVIADQGDFDDLPAVMQADGLNGGGIWDIVEYNGSLYVTVVTDRDIGGQVHKQGFALYRGDANSDGTFSWTQVVGDQGSSGYGFGMGISHSAACNLWVYDGYLYLGTCNDPILDLAEIPATGNFEVLYNDLDHSIYLYRMDENEDFQMVGGKNDNPSFPDGPMGNLGAGLGNHSNQCLRRMGVHNDELYIGTYDMGILTYIFTRTTDGRVAQMDQEDMAARGAVLEQTLTEVLQPDNKYVAWFLEEAMVSETVTGLCQALVGLATETVSGRNPVPEYRARLSEYEAFREQVYALLAGQLSDPAFLTVYQDKTGVVRYAGPETAPADFIDDRKAAVRERVDRLFANLDDILYDEMLHDFVYYLGCNYYAGQAERGFDLLVSRDGVSFDAITRDGFGDGANQGLGAVCSTEYGVFLGTANPCFGTQLWLMSSDRDLSRTAQGERPIPAETQVPTEPEKTVPPTAGKPTETTVPAKPDSSQPQTGDEALLPWFVWVILSAGILCLTVRRKRC